MATHHTSLYACLSFIPFLQDHHIFAMYGTVLLLSPSHATLHGYGSFLWQYFNSIMILSKTGNGLPWKWKTHKIRDVRHF